MSYPYFFIDPQHINKDQALLKGDDFFHLKKVLRASPQDKVMFSDDSGCRYQAKVAAVEEKQIVLSIDSRKAVGKRFPLIVLYQCILKKNAMELLLQKACEIGADIIVPVYSQRVVAGIGKVKTERWQKIARQASMQSKRDYMTEVRPPLTIDKINPKDHGLFLLPYEESDLRFTLEKGLGLESLGLLVGPEGGFEAREVEMLKQKGASVISFGKNILRAETAAWYLLSVIDYTLKDNT
jgi:16S rRNA (uracil1498-N3)-methyltransferase